MADGECTVAWIAIPGEREEDDPALVGLKSAGLARASRIGLPVPEAFVLSTAWCRGHRESEGSTQSRLREVVADSIARLERATELRFGDAKRPLLVSVRSGAPISMPGMLDTVLNIGLCETTLPGLLRISGNPRLQWDSYRRLIEQFGEVVSGLDPAPFRELTAGALAQVAVATTAELSFVELRALARDALALYRDIAGHAFPQDPREQLERAILAVFASWDGTRARAYRRLHGLGDGPGTAVTVQRMVFGNAGGTSGAGVGFTRDPSSGENRPYVDFAFNCQGEDIVSGRRTAEDDTRLTRALPETARQLRELRGQLEREFRDAQEFEFTIQDGRLFLLQTRPAKRTTWAALRIAVDQVQEGLLQPDEALERLQGIALESVTRSRVVPTEDAALLAQAVSAGSGVASGPIALDAQSAHRAAQAGRPAILVRERAETVDIEGIAAAAGFLCARGSRTSHAAVVARQLGRPCVVGCDALAIDEEAGSVSIAGTSLKSGDILSIDAGSGRIFLGRAETVTERPADLLAEIARWRAPQRGQDRVSPA